MPWRHMGGWLYKSWFSLPEHELEMSGELHAPNALTSGRHPKFLLDRTRIQPFGCPVHSKSLYWLYYPGSCHSYICVWKLNQNTNRVMATISKVGHMSMITMRSNEHNIQGHLAYVQFNSILIIVFGDIIHTKSYAHIWEHYK
jgi:hypothetical protein